MPGNITTADSQYALDIVKTICTQAGPGMPGTPQERLRAVMIQKELEAHLGSENVALEEYTLAPWAMLSSYPISALLMLIALLLNISIGRFTGVSPWLTASAALVFSILASLAIISEFILNKGRLDRFFKQKQSVNVSGRLRKPGSGEVKRLLILSGHHDSAPENTWLGLLGDLSRRLAPEGHLGRTAIPWLRRLGYVFFFLSTTWLLGYIALLALSLIQMAGLIAPGITIARSGTLGWILLVYPIAPSIIFALFFNRGRKNGGSVPGAADNLSASATAAALCRFLVANPADIPADTEIRFISFGGEESGLRGSRAYVRRHLDELRRLDVRLLNFETVTYPEITIFTSDMNGLVKNSPEMVKSVVAAAERAGVPYKLSSAFLGVGNDSGPFSQAGLKAATLFPFKTPQQMVAFYHQKWDRPEVLTIEPLLNVLKLTFEWVRCGGE